MGMNTEERIPRKLKSAAYDLWGRDGCVICGSTNTTDLAHVSHDGSNPYKDTEPFNLLPLCRSCHNKVDWGEHKDPSNFPDKYMWRKEFMRSRGCFFKLTALYLVKHMAGMTSLTFFEFLNDNFDNIIEADGLPFREDQKEKIKESYERLGANFEQLSINDFPGKMKVDSHE